MISGKGIAALIVLLGFLAVLPSIAEKLGNPDHPGNSEIEKLKEYKGKAYRVDIENWGIPGRATVADIIRFEREELGNVYPVSDALMKELDQYSYRDAVWVTKEKEIAAEYLSEGMTEADISEMDVGEGAKIITGDELGGYFVLYGGAKPKPLSVKI
jgi:hypothetical protein